MTFEAIKSKIDQGQFSPIYFLYGKESYFIDNIIEDLYEKVIPEETRDFNLTTIYGGETNAESLIPILRRYPMMSERQLVVLKEAQAMRDFSNLEPYFEQPSSSTVFAIAYKNKSPDKRKTFVKKLLKVAVSMESKPLYDNQVPSWITNYVRSQGRKIDNRSTLLLAEYLGTDLSRISNEIQKLLLNLSADKTIDNDDIEKYIGISKEYNIFELQSALATGQVDRVFKIVHNFMANPKEHPIQLITASLNTFFVRVGQVHLLPKKDPKSVQYTLGLPFQRLASEYLQASKYFSLSRTYRISDILLEYDAKSKGYGAGSDSSDSLLFEMFVKILS